MSRRDAAWLADILEAIDAIEAYLAEGSLTQGMVYDACQVRLNRSMQSTAGKAIHPHCHGLECNPVGPPTAYRLPPTAYRALVVTPVDRPAVVPPGDPVTWCWYEGGSRG